MLYELRSYDVHPEQWDAFLVWAERQAFPLLLDHFGFRLVGYWSALSPASEATPVPSVHWMLAWESEEEMLERWAAAIASPEAWTMAWNDGTDPATGTSRFYLQTRTTLLQPLTPSPLR